VTLVPTRHWSARGLFDRNKALWASFVLETPAGKLYIVCDSGYGDGKHFRRVAEAHGRCGWRSCRSAPMSRAGS
jgi:L-ascorbate metabolism protein UlaG (beta-lactamase superfamily)